jgi:hypothetical protein
MTGTIVLAIAALALTVMLSGAPGRAQERSGGEVLYQLELVTRLDGETRGGPFDTSVPIDRRLVRRVHNCVTTVRAVGIDWAKKQALVTARDALGKQSLLLHFESQGAGGLYEVVYSVDVSRGYASGRFKFWDSSGTIRSQHTGRHQEFSEQLKKAMQCGS